MDLLLLENEFLMNIVVEVFDIIIVKLCFEKFVEKVMEMLEN